MKMRQTSRMDAIRPRLETEWRADMAALGLSANTDVLDEILRRYGEPHRRYHAVSHLDAMFRLLAEHAPEVAAGSPARLAVWWHDAIYDPRARDNEEQSAALARDHLIAMGVADPLIATTVELTLMTRHHWRATGADAAGEAFLDADIAILGAPPHIYDRYSADVRTEYAYASDDAFRAGRSAFLRGALAEPRLYRSAGFFAAFEASARANLAREFASLTPP